MLMYKTIYCFIDDRKLQSARFECSWWPPDFFHCAALWLYASVSEQQGASIFSRKDGDTDILDTANMLFWMKMTVFWDVVPCGLVKVYLHFLVNRRLWNVSKLLLEYSSQHPRGQSFLHCLLWEPEISPFYFITCITSVHCNIYIYKRLFILNK
jgi:hypothetical protein